MGVVINFSSLEEAIDCYGRENLVPITKISQVIDFVKEGCQPRFIWEKEGSVGIVTYWYLKSEFLYVRKKLEKKYPERYGKFWKS